MSPERIKELLKDYKNSVARLKEALELDLTSGALVLDGTIKRFEFTFELGWKLARAILDDQGVVVNSPRAAIKEAFRINLIQDGEGWIKMLEERNKTSHIYDENQAKEIYQQIKKFHFKLLQDLSQYSDRTKLI